MTTEKRIKSLSELQPGDHIKLPCEMGGAAKKKKRKVGGVIAHHAIVVEVVDEKTLKVIHNNGELVVEEVDEFDPEELTVVVYSECNSPDVVLYLARSKLGLKYNTIKENCEHFATWAKTGKPESKQVQAGMTGGAIGTLGGAAVGAAAGAALGSFVPVIGTGIGALIGGLSVGLLGAGIGSSTALKTHNKGKK